MISDKALDELEVSRDIIPMDTALYALTRRGAGKLLAMRLRG